MERVTGVFKKRLGGVCSQKSCKGFFILLKKGVYKMLTLNFSFLEQALESLLIRFRCKALISGFFWLFCVKSHKDFEIIMFEKLIIK